MIQQVFAAGLVLQATLQRLGDAVDTSGLQQVIDNLDEAIRQIRALKRPHGRTAIIGVSGRGEDEEAARQAGADAFLVKPVSPRALATALLAARRRGAAAP